MTRIGAAMSTVVLALALGATSPGALAQVVTDVQCAQCVGTTDIAVDAITTGRLRNNAVTGAKIKDGAITESKLGAGAVTTSRIGLGAVREGRIANNAVTTPKIADGAITESKLGAGAVTNSRIGLGAVREGRIANNAVTTPKIADGAITESKLGVGAVTNSRIAVGAVREVRIADGAVTNKKIGLGTVREGRIANGAVTAAKLGLANTTFVEDSENDTANCNALRAALNAAVSPAVVVLGPGTFACGTNPVVLPPGVGLIGSGRNVTDITGNIEGLDGLVRLTDDTSLSHLTVTNVAMTVNDVIVGIGIGTATVNARRWLISDVTANAGDSDSTAIAIYVKGDEFGTPIDCDGGELINVTANGTEDAGQGLHVACNAGSVTGTKVKAIGDGSGVVKGLSSTLTLRNSVISGGFNSMSVFDGVLEVFSSEIDGTVNSEIGGTPVCVGDYDETGAALANGTFGAGGCV